MIHSFNTEIAAEIGLEEAILVQNIYFWCQKNLANNKLTNGKPFTYNSVKAFNQLHPYMSPSTISRALKNLEVNGFIEIGEFNSNAYDHTKWYCTTEKTNSFYDSPKKEKGFSENNNSDFQNTNSICQIEKSNEEIEKSNCEKSEMNIADRNTDIKPFKNTDTESVQEKIPCAFDDSFSELSDGQQADLLTDQNKYYSKLVFDVWEKAQLPGWKKGFLNFHIRDFRLALSDLRNQHLHSDDVIQACKNYASVIELKRKGQTWWTSESLFYNFAKPTTIGQFLPDSFDIERFKKSGDKKGGSAISRSDEYSNVEVGF